MIGSLATIRLSELLLILTFLVELLVLGAVLPLELGPVLELSLELVAKEGLATLLVELLLALSLLGTELSLVLDPVPEDSSKLLEINDETLVSTSGEVEFSVGCEDPG